MHGMRKIEYDSDHVLMLTFEDGAVRRVDLGQHLCGEVFEPLKDTAYFRTAWLEPDLDAVVGDNGAEVLLTFSTTSEPLSAGQQALSERSGLLRNGHEGNDGQRPGGMDG